MVKTKKRTKARKEEPARAPLPVEVIVSGHLTRHEIEQIEQHAREEVGLDQLKEDWSEEQQRKAVEHELATADEMQEAKVSNSIVAAKFKDRYIEHAKELGVKGKAARRSNWDWLAQAIARHCLDKTQKIDMEIFLHILAQNGVDYSKWDNRSRGWEGRLRMTGRVALQRIVADRKVLKIGDETLVPPDDFVAKYKTKE